MDYNCRGNAESKREIKLTEDDIVKAARVVLPAANLAIRKTRELFSGDPSITLKVCVMLISVQCDVGRELFKLSSQDALY